MSFLVTFFATKPVEYSGEILDIGKNHITIKHKKPHSSKFIVTTFAKASLLSYSAALTPEGFVITKPEKIEQYSVIGEVTFKTPTKAIVVTDRGKIEFDPTFATITADSKEMVKERKAKSEAKPKKIVLKSKSKVSTSSTLENDDEQEFYDD